jgi:hypothetical protein
MHHCATLETKHGHRSLFAGQGLDVDEEQTPSSFDFHCSLGSRLFLHFEMVAEIEKFVLLI